MDAVGRATHGAVAETRKPPKTQISKDFPRIVIRHFCDNRSWRITPRPKDKQNG
ncbi:hypothetical protein [Methyloglobulus sp.]|uniref:hypothetical protein n=1 Tax=Methyloglobulus sp. TaxID=2518622 RepID=UPI003988C4AB